MSCFEILKIQGTKLAIFPGISVDRGRVAVPGGLISVVRPGVRKLFGGRKTETSAPGGEEVFPSLPLCGAEVDPGKI